MPQKLKVQLPKFDFRAQFEPQKINTEARTAELVWSTGAKVLRSGWDGRYYEQLSMEPNAVRLERLNGGAPLLNSHNAYNLDHVLGVVERAWLEDGVGKATVRFAKDDEEADKVWRKVQDGIIRNVSVGYSINKFEQVEGGDDKIPVYRATDWEPMEISLVPIGADASAGVRSENVKRFDCEIVTRNFKLEGETMNEKEFQEMKAKLEAAEKRAAELEGAEKAAAEAANKRAAEILEGVRKAGLESSFAEELIKDTSVSLDAARAKIIDKIAEKSPKIDGRNGSAVITRDESDTMVRGIESAILHRHNPQMFKLEDEGKQYRNLSLVGMAKEVLESSGVKTRYLSNMEVAALAFKRSGGMHTTSDFPEILANVMNKTLRSNYDEAPATYGPIVREVEVPDFKQISRTQLGDAPQLVEVPEHGEVQKGSMSEYAEKYAVKKFGKIVAVTREAIVNDDLGAFMDVPAKFGVAARNLISDKVWDIFNANANMADGFALFSSQHANLGTSNSAISGGLAQMRQLMKKQKGLGGVQYINLMPRFLIVPAERETEAEALVNTLVVPESPTNANPYIFARTLSIIAEPRLSAAPYYLAAAVGQIDIIEIAFLQGQRGPRIETKLGFEVEGMEVKSMLEFNCKAIDWKGLVKNAGV